MSITPATIIEEFILTLDFTTEECRASKYTDEESYAHCNNLESCINCLFDSDTFDSVGDFTDYLLEHKLITKEALLQLTLDGAFNKENY